MECPRGDYMEDPELFRRTVILNVARFMEGVTLMHSQVAAPPSPTPSHPHRGGWYTTPLLPPKPPSPSPGLMEGVTPRMRSQVGQVSSYGKDVRFTSFAWPDGEMMGTRQTAMRQAALTTFTSVAMPRLMVRERGQSGRLGGAVSGHHGLLRLHLKACGCPAHSLTCLPRLVIQVSPGSDGDWSLTLFPKDPETGRTLPALRRVFYEFQSGLARLSEEAQAHNDGAGERPFPYNYTLHSCDPAIMDTSISV